MISHDKILVKNLMKRVSNMSAIGTL